MSDNDALMKALTTISRQREREEARKANGLLTRGEAAAKLGCSVKTLDKHVAAGALSYVLIGHGTKHLRRMFTDDDLAIFIETQKRKEFSACQSLKTPARRIGGSTFKSTVVAFSAQQRPRQAGSGSRRTRRARKGAGAHQARGRLNFAAAR
jgi:hypothetical protein